MSARGLDRLLDLAPTATFVGEGAEGWVYRLGDRAFKVARHGRYKLGLAQEAETLAVLDAAGAPVARFYAYYPEVDVIEREFVEDVSGVVLQYGMREVLIRKAMERIEALCRRHEMTAPEFKNDSFVITEVRGAYAAVMVDLGFAFPTGRRLRDKIHAMIDAKADLWDVSFELKGAVSHEDVTDAEAAVLLDRIRTTYGEVPDDLARDVEYTQRTRPQLYAASGKPKGSRIPNPRRGQR